MRFDDRFLDEIKSRVRLSDFIGKSVRLKRQGREFVGLSPFTKERTPSFFVNDDKGFFHDFSSGKHGDLITFLQETERLSFVEAVERLAAEAGVPLPAPDPTAEAQSKRRQGLADWLEAAASWFEAELRRPVGAEARAYLARRALPESAWARFRLGYAPGARTALKDYLVAKGARPAELVEAGLLIAPEDGGAPYDRFRNRIIFPIGDQRGRVVSFGGRALDPEARAKYLNGPDTALFDKGRLLYGYHLARPMLVSAGESGALTIVEGYMDVIAAQGAGVPAVAPLGTSLTEAQMELAWRVDPEPVVAFDADAAGRAAAGRTMERALPLLSPSRSLRFAQLEGGKDADEVVRARGAAALKAQLAAAAPFVEALFARERDASSLETPERRAALKRRLRVAAAAIGDSEVARAYEEVLLARYGALFPPIARREGRSFRQDRWFEQPPPPTPEGKAAAQALSRAIKPAAAALARQALADPDLIDEHLEGVQARGFGDPALAAVAKEIVALRLTADRLDSEGLRRHLRDHGFSALLIDIDRAADRSSAPFLKEDVTLAAARSQWSHGFAALSRLAALDEEIAAAKGELGGGLASSAFIALKGRRDLLRRRVEAEEIWTSDGSE
ncbi:MAG TPA: DNA primase [Caulobacteraceae bacterium]|nr:DNA primase [Caulobacteraceae bacterium]